jgi:N-methylhydantoinase A
VIEMVEIGAGGGSLARLDALERVTVGPESASSVPGPVCYNGGGSDPAVTDADVALGLIDPTTFAGGTIKLYPGLVKKALKKVISDPLGLDEEMAAYAVYEMVCENMASTARVHQDQVYAARQLQRGGGDRIAQRHVPRYSRLG